MIQVSVGLALSICLGATGGAILAWPFSAIGALVGFIYAAPVGLAIGIICAVKRWPCRCVVISCFCQFAGAMLFGLTSRQVYDDMPVNAACAGELIGAFVGICIASGFVPPEKKPGECVQCQYNLTGLTEPRCPECGTPFDPELLKKLEPKNMNVVSK